MSDRYSLSPRQARLSRMAAWAFVLAAIVQLSAALVPVFAASAVTRAICADDACRAQARPEMMLPEDVRPSLPTDLARLADYVRRPSIRLALAALALAGALPFTSLMLCVAGALRRLAARTPDSLSAALPWLRRASFAALAVAIVPPFAMSARIMLLLPATPSGPYWYFMIDFGRFLLGLLLALAAFAITWALAAGSRAGRDLAEFV